MTGAPPINTHNPTPYMQTDEPHSVDRKDLVSRCKLKKCMTPLLCENTGMSYHGISKSDK